jgi:hypothetical protein
MKLFGHRNDELPIEDRVSVELAEVTLNATPQELRRMAEFLNFCAAEMDRMGIKYDHVHLSDRMKEFRESPHFVVMRGEG